MQEDYTDVSCSLFASYAIFIWHYNQYDRPDCFICKKQILAIKWMYAIHLIRDYHLIKN